MKFKRNDQVNEGTLRDVYIYRPRFSNSKPLGSEEVQEGNSLVFT
ncbi:hypothetical protein L915_00027 [Phytophthora nicotianae]|uniref:Uncharacterized protein n=1 Tax=Phytophthora nicotianae TaxID=4792 RepID=W2JWP4_PHYNI|nr:hypothetical protein L915_00027 [Phytophthora nicotianae]ETL50776.1 hypothetical protein L916_00023 [Phytophthora nicotianae]